MRIRSFEDMAARVQVSVPKCPFPTVMQYTRNAAINVCEKTLFWKYAHSAFDLTAGQPEYRYKQPPDTVVHVILYCSVNGVPLRPIDYEQAFSLYPEWVKTYTEDDDIRKHGSIPSMITEVDPSKFVLLPPPNAEKTYSLQMISALKPSRDAEGMEEYVMDDMEDVILSKTLVDLLVLPGAEWSDRELASYHAKQYNAGLVEKRARARQGKMMTEIKVVPPSFS